MKTILLVRHGETAAEHGAFCGHMNVELSGVGQQQSVFCAQAILQNKAQLVVTTGMKRTDHVGQ